MLEFKKGDIKTIPVIQSIAYQVWPRTYADILSHEQLSYMLEMMYSTEALTEQIRRHNHQFTLVYEQNQPVAFASFSRLATDDAGFKLHKIYICLENQGRGIGKELLRYIVSLIQPLGASYLDLNVNKQNRARFFYEKMGFTIVREEDIDIGNGFFMNDYVMRLHC